LNKTADDLHQQLHDSSTQSAAQLQTAVNQSDAYKAMVDKQAAELAALSRERDELRSALSSSVMSSTVEDS
jgi:hypothetical protein